MQLFKQGAAAMGLALTETALAQFEQYWAYLVERNQVMNLTAITDRDEIAVKHFLDSLALASVVDLSGKRLIDIGTGAGFPGLPLKITIPSLEVTLLDGHNKRVTFLAELCAQLGLEGIQCIHARAEEWVATPGEREGYDYATSRAVARLNILAELCLPYVKPGGAFLPMKAVDSDEEIGEAEAAVKILGGETEGCHDYTLPGTDIQRRIVDIRKVAPTPEKYPRRFARIQKDPLG
ncbi:MAG: 16S rRNA (guanine(527)-N(7))-methyltransferase RsmG [Oscillospiraceae bacterium]|nr:16S rRNA (guanine(527)-N(7))-methyltransferase RsmG [Oscillospiraceae bacterium]